MGLTKNSLDKDTLGKDLVINKRDDGDKIIALAGNPNVGKSTVFNGLTGMNQHTGNWSGKTVSNAQGYCKSEKNSYVMVDIPGTYSLMAHSPEEEVARDFVCFGEHDCVVVVCDATCLERNLNLVLQVIETSSRVVLCVNLLDEAKRKKIHVDLEALEARLGVHVVGIVARKKKSLYSLMQTVERALEEAPRGYTVRYPKEIEHTISMLEPTLAKSLRGRLSSRWLALKLLDCDDSLHMKLKVSLGDDFFENGDLIEALDSAQKYLAENNIDSDTLKDMTVHSLVGAAEKICSGVVSYECDKYSAFDRKADRLLTSRVFGYPIMIALLALIFWLTVVGANYPSSWLSSLLFKFQDVLSSLFLHLGAPDWLHGVVVLGAYRVFAWVVSVMLPPMAIFFPLFTLLEDSGYLPRIAYNLDKPFKCCQACGKQALTMCMGFGCNAVGVVGCRIIDSPRERMLAILTNSFVPCNGRFPMLVSIITMFFVSSGSSLVSALILTLVIVLGVCATFAVTKLLSKTLLRGMPSSFTLELPPYRRPQFAKVAVRSFFDRTLFVLGRAVVVAIPAGIVIWLMANVPVGDVSLLRYCADFLDPFARLMGLDGVILIAFILGAPANEIVIPIMIMAYMSGGTLVELDGIWQMRELFAANGWTFITAGSVIIFSMMHWPCLTTLLTIKKETGSLKWTALAAAIPTVIGIVLCMLFANIARVFVGTF